MGNPLRDRRPLAELAAKGQVFEIAEKIGDFKRLAQIVEADLDTLDADRIPPNWRDSSLTGRLEFRFADAQRQIIVLEGDVAASVDAVCQRCLEPLRVSLSASLKLMPVTSAATAAEGADFEVWELDDDKVCPADIVEEALIMAMPFAAVHESADECKSYNQAADDAERTTKPFANLKARLEENR